ncbi:Cap [Circoviridae sp.]|nr:Cap [Circoviridae sp.]QYM90071.1 Cap [Circoviridae sp.]UNO37822.1 hypothetical protein [Po-Circo-like virus]
MFDPHRTRRNDSRYYSRKGQVLQASRVNVNPVIDQRLVPIYQNYLVKNNLVPTVPKPTEPINIQGFYIGQYYWGISNAYRSDESIVNMTFQGAQEYGSYYMILYRDTVDAVHFITGKVSAGSSINMTVENNVHCLYKTMNFRSTDNPSSYDGWKKGLYTKYEGENIVFLLTTGNELDIGNMITVSFR